MNRLPTEKQTLRINSHVEGNSLRATPRMCDAETGQVCEGYLRRMLANLPCKRIQCDETWSFCYDKDKNIPPDNQGQPGVGSVWTWTAMCADTKLVPSWVISDRNAGTALAFLHDLAGHLANRVQLTTDGHRAYLTAVQSAFGTNVDYVMLVEMYGSDREEGEVDYSPAECIGCQMAAISGNPNPRHISTSYVELQNLTMRMKMRRFTRLTNAFSKKPINHRWAVALHFVHYNFYCVHQTLRVTPAMEPGITDHTWSIEEIVGLLHESTENVA